MPATETTAIRICDLNKQYSKIHAVKGVSLDIYKGEIFGFIGPDGAGKSSIFNILGGIMQPTSGCVKIFENDPSVIRSKIGYLTQQFSFYLDLTVDENIEYSAGIRKVPREVIDERKERYLKLVGMERFKDRLAGQLSGGMKQKLALCCVLVFQPELLLLDEPTTGVDPVSRREFWDTLATLSGKENVTIVVATPYLDEAERCNRVALVYDGQFQQVGTPQELKDRLGLYRLVVRTDNLEKSESILRNIITDGHSTIADIQPFGDRLDVLAKNPEQGTTEIRSILTSENIHIMEMREADITLENVFINLLREKGSSAAFKPFPYSKVEKNKNNNNSKVQNNIAIGAYDLCKKFGSFEAVKNVNLEVKYGEIFCLLGANGAGKTTTVKMLCGLLTASCGEIYLGGESGNLRSSRLRQRIGYMSQKFTLYDDLTILENLKFYCGVYGIPQEQRPDKIEWALATSGLLGQENMLTGDLPGGWKQRVSFSASVMHEPDILFLDEPTSGVDPLARKMFWEMIGDIARHGTAVLVITHYLEEAEHCNRMAFMTAGQIVAQGTPQEIKESQKGTLIEISVDNPQKVYAVAKALYDPWRVSLFGTKLHIVLEDPEKEIPKAKEVLSAENLRVFSAYKVPFSLEDAFIGIIERAGD